MEYFEKLMNNGSWGKPLAAVDRERNSFYDLGRRPALRHGEHWR